MLESRKSVRGEEGGGGQNFLASNDTKLDLVGVPHGPHLLVRHIL